MIKNIKNIYYMLSYAFQALKQDKYESCKTENFENAADLLAEIIIKSLNAEVKKGLNRQYNLKEEQLSIPKGKFNISASIKNSAIYKKQLICEFDEFSLNSYMNKIVKTTASLLIKADIAKDRKKNLKKLMIYFAEVEELNPFTINWKINFNKNNQTYKLLIFICWLTIKGLIQSNENGTFRINSFIDEQKMCKLYEKFILEFYKKEYPNLNVSSSQIKWDLDDDNYEMLPIMRSDVMIENDKNVLIIDAKYYTNSMQKRYDKLTLHSNNLYQIFTYVKNKNNCKKKVSGLLLYAKTDELIFPNNSYLMNGNKISAMTLDLDLDFAEIKNQLNNILKMHDII